jgi:hypothetical protein
MLQLYRIPKAPAVAVDFTIVIEISKIDDHTPVIARPQAVAIPEFFCGSLPWIAALRSP